MSWVSSKSGPTNNWKGIIFILFFKHLARILKDYFWLITQRTMYGTLTRICHNPWYSEIIFFLHLTRCSKISQCFSQLLILIWIENTFKVSYCIFRLLCWVRFFFFFFLICFFLQKICIFWSNQCLTILPFGTSSNLWESSIMDFCFLLKMDAPSGMVKAFGSFNVQGKTAGG